MNGNKKIWSLLLIFFVLGASGGYVYYTYYYSKPDASGPTNSLLSVVDQTANPFSDSVDNAAAAATFDFAPATTTISDTDTSDPNLNPTEKMARDLFTKYTQARQKTDITADNADEFATDYMSTVKLPEVTAKQYTAKDILTGPSNQATLKDYHDAVVAITTKYWPDPSNNELIVIQNALSNNALPTVDILTPFIKKYQSLALGLTEFAVPSIAVDLHVQVINSIQLYVAALQMVAHNDSDPLSAMVGVRDFTNYQQSMISNFSNLQNFFSNNLH